MIRIRIRSSCRFTLRVKIRVRKAEIVLLIQERPLNCTWPGEWLKTPRLNEFNGPDVAFFVLQFDK